VKLHVDFVDQLSGEVQVSAKRLLESAESWQYSFDVQYDGHVLATGRAAIVARADRDRRRSGGQEGRS